MNKRLDINFLFKVCSSCKKQFPKTPQYFNNNNNCVYCEKNIDFYNHKNSKERKIYLSNRQKDKVKNLDNEYILSLLKGKKRGISKNVFKNHKELIRLKRLELQLKRELKKWKNTKNT